MFFLRVFFINLLVFFSTSIAAQSPSYKVYDPQDGLVQSQVIDVFKDSRSYLWIGCKGGVSKFDGENFENFGFNDGLMDAHISKIIETNDGEICFASSQGIHFYDGNKITAFPIGDIGPSKIHSLDVDDQGTIWIGRNNAPHFLIFKDSSYQVIDHPANHFQQLSRGLKIDKRTKKIYGVIDTHGLYEINEHELIEVKVGDNPLVCWMPFVSKNEPLKVFFRTDSKKAETFIIENNKLLPSSHHYLNENKIIDLYENVSSSFYRTVFYQLEFIDKNNKRTEKILDLSEEQGKLMFLEEEGSIWLGSEDGLIQFYNNGFATIKNEKMENAWSILEDKNGEILLCGYNTGLYKFDGEQVAELTSYLKETNNSKAFYFGALKDKHENLLFPMHQGILKKTDDVFSLIRSGANNSDANLILIEDEERDFLLSGVRGGINIIKNYKVDEYIGQEQGLHKNRYIVSILKDAHNNFWLGSYNGLAHLDWKTKKIKNYTKDNGKLAASGIISSHTDTEGLNWFGSTNGLFLYSEEKDSLIHVAENELKRAINFICKFDNKHLLIGQQDGLFVFDREQFVSDGTIKLHFYNHRNGYEGIEPNQNTVFTDSKGRIWIGSSTKTVVLDPRKLVFDYTPLETRITKVNRNSITYNSKSSDIKKGIGRVEFEFEAIGFNRPSSTQYSYILENYDEEWSPWVANNYVNYSGLSSGSYKFKVKAKGGSKVGISPNEDVHEIKINLSPWKEPGFYKFAAIGLALLLLSTFFYFLRSKQNERLANIKDKQIQYLEIQTLQSQMHPHFIFNTLMAIQNKILNQNAEEANDLLVKLSNLIRAFLDSSVGSNIDIQNKLSREKNLDDEIDFLKVYIELEQVSSPANFEYNIEIDETLDLHNISIPPMILQPFVENAIKHGIKNLQNGKGVLSLKFIKNGDALKVKVEDNGVGVEASMLINKNRKSKNRSHGTELVNKRIVRLNEIGHSISLKTSNIESGGTLVEINFDSI